MWLNVFQNDQCYQKLFILESYISHSLIIRNAFSTKHLKCPIVLRNNLAFFSFSLPSPSPSPQSILFFLISLVCVACWRGWLDSLPLTLRLDLLSWLEPTHLSQSLVKQSSLDDSFESGLARDEDDDLMDGLKTNSDDESPPTPPRPATPTVSHRSLPWKPKVRLLIYSCYFFFLSIAWIYLQ